MTCVCGLQTHTRVTVTTVGSRDTALDTNPLTVTAPLTVTMVPDGRDRYITNGYVTNWGGLKVQHHTVGVTMATVNDRVVRLGWPFDSKDGRVVVSPVQYVQVMNNPL